MRRTVLRLLVLLVLLAVGLVPVVQADYWHGEVYYYPDASYCSSCGYFVRYCDNSYEQWGCQTVYSREYPFNCDIEY